LLCVLGWALALSVSTAKATTKVFEYTGGEQTFEVPGGVHFLHVRLIGGSGGEGGSVGGASAEVTGDLEVTPGLLLYVEVGGVGEDGGAGGAGGFNGGANGGGGAGGGGGASDIRLTPRSAGLAIDTREAVAAGGGGGAGNGETSAGGVGGNAGSGGGTSEGGNEGGGAGTESTGGGGGSGCSASGTTGERGSGGPGGAGFSANGGGGGGGGLFGGGGGGGGCGAGGGGGGGGSSLVPLGGELELASISAAPTVEISYTPPPPPPSNPPVNPAPAVAPNTVLGFHPPKKAKTAKAKAKVKFTFSASAAGATFKCKVDKGAFAPCTSPKTYKVKPGKHKFSVEAISGGLTDSSPATFSFKVTKTS
jgi:hypothetical protein